MQSEADTVSYMFLTTVIHKGSGEGGKWLYPYVVKIEDFDFNPKGINLVRIWVIWVL